MLSHFPLRGTAILSRSSGDGGEVLSRDKVFLSSALFKRIHQGFGRGVTPSLQSLLNLVTMTVTCGLVCNGNVMFETEISSFGKI